MWLLFYILTYFRVSLFTNIMPRYLHLLYIWYDNNSEVACIFKTQILLSHCTLKKYFYPIATGSCANDTFTHTMNGVCTVYTESMKSFFNRKEQTEIERNRQE